MGQSLTVLLAWVSRRVREPRSILLFGWFVAIAYAFPGYLNWDAGEQLYQARVGPLEDWHPPLMAAYWLVIETVVRGPIGMLVLQVTLFSWGLYATLRLRFQPPAAAIGAVALLLFPPVLTPMAPVWKDAQMAAFLIAGTLLAMRDGWWRRVLGCVLLVLAAGVRDNGAAALPPLCLLIVASWQLRSRRQTWLIAIGVFCAIVVVTVLANRAVRDRGAYPWYRTVAIHDIAGTICFADPLTDEQVRELLDGVPLRVHDNLQANMCRLYDERAWFKLSFDAQPMFDMRPPKSDRLARRAAWRRVVKTHPHAFASHRWAVMKQVLGLSESPPWEPVCQTIAANPDHGARIGHEHSLSWFQRRLGRFFQDRLATTILYRPWFYLVLSVVFFAYGVVKRDRLLVALLGSGVLYEASYFVAAAAPDFRYSHWMITCCCLAIAIVVGERLRAGRAQTDAGGDEGRSGGSGRGSGIGS